jgi:hypothetical protein
MKKQTAVEWLEEKLKTYCLLTISIKADFEQAKEMDKEQMIQFTNNYLRQIYEVGEMTIEDFYNETYGGDK